MQSLSTTIKGIFRAAVLAGAVTLTVACAAVTASEPAQAFEHADLRATVAATEGAVTATPVWYYGYRRFYYRPFRFGYRPYYGFRRFGYRPYYGYGFRRFGYGYRRFY